MYHVSPVFMYLLYSCIRRINIVKETWFLSLGWEDPLEDGMTAQSSILAWKIPMDKSSLVGYSPWGHKELDTTEWLSTAHKWYHIIFVCFFLTYFTYYDHLWTHPCGCKWHFILYGLVIFHYTYEPHTHKPYHTHTCTASSLPIHLLMDTSFSSMSWLLEIVLLWTLRCK